MATKLLFIIPFLFSINLSAQSTITFSYDSAGNQVLRDRIVIKSSAKSIKDSVPDSAITKNKEENFFKSDMSVVAYPNPVTNILRIAWKLDENDSNQEVILSSMTGQQLDSFKIKSTTGEYPLGFQKYPSGVYLISVYSTNGVTKTFKIIKK